MLKIPFDNYTYIASCVFTKTYPELSDKIQPYIKRRWDMDIVRCCVPKYKVKEFEEQMPDFYREKWKDITHSKEFTTADTVVSLCHNCSAIIEETLPAVGRLSLWEVILEDEAFSFPDYGGQKMTIQDCWRSYDNRAEQNAVRTLLKKMNINIVELEDKYEKINFCGITLYQPAPPRNLKLAPIRFVENAKGKFISHSEKEKQQLMVEYCRKFTTEKVVAYCHYCAKGLQIGGKKVAHIAELLFQ